MTVCLLDAARAEAWRQSINSDGEFKLKSRDMALSLSVQIGDERRLLVFRDGRLVSIAKFMALAEPVDVTIKGSVEFWQKLLAKVPPPRFQNLYAGVRFGTCEVSGNGELYFAYFAAITRLIEAMREFENR